MRREFVSSVVPLPANEGIPVRAGIPDSRRVRWDMNFSQVRLLFEMARA